MNPLEREVWRVIDMLKAIGINADYADVWHTLFPRAVV